MENETTIHQVVVEEEETKILFFPQEIVEEILSRLPVKSLCRFKCVSKHWLSLITDPHLAKSHLQKTITNDRLRCERKRVIMCRRNNVYSLEYESMVRNDENTVALELDFPLKQPYVGGNRVNILGSCNGLVCISPDRNTFFLFNPSTREYKRIPDSPCGLDPLRMAFHCFGYVNNDYKIVQVGYDVLVYSLRADSWKFVCRSPFHCLCGPWSVVNGPGTLLNGAFHWLASFRDEETRRVRRVVAAFGLDEEVLSYMPAPDCVGFRQKFVVGVVNRRLCVFHRQNDWLSDIPRHFWMMNEYGVGESWTKIDLGFVYRLMKPLCFAWNGDSLLLVDGRLLMCNFKDGSLDYLVVHGFPEEYHCGADIYVETLVSPNAAIGLELDAVLCAKEEIRELGDQETLDFL